MAKKNRPDYKSSINARFFTNLFRYIKGNTVRDGYLDTADSFLNIETDANVPGGYMAIDLDGRADYSFVKDVTPVGKYLKDDGTWGFVPVSSSLTDGYMYIGNASNIAIERQLTLSATPGTFAMTNTGILTFPDSSAGSRGFLSSTDWSTFNSKQSALGFTPVNKAGDTMAGALVLNADAVNPMEAVTYQQLIAWQTGLWDDRGNFDASGNAFPTTGGSGTGGAILKGDIWTISVPGILGGQSVNNSDTVRSRVNSPGNTLTDWAIGEGNLGYTPVSNVMNAGYIFVGNASNVATPMAPTLNATAGTFTLSNTGEFTFPDGSAGGRGFISSTDWSTFNGKQAALGYTPVNKAGDTMTGLLVLSGNATASLGAVTLQQLLLMGAREVTQTNGATITVNVDTTDIAIVTGLNTNTTFGVPAGTPFGGKKFILRITDNAIARTLAFNAIFNFSPDLPAPTTTVISKTIYLGFIYNATTSKYDCIAHIPNY